MERSPRIKGFIAYRGTPDALEIRKLPVGPYRIRMYYLDSAEQYDLEKGSIQWLIRGPEPLPQKVVDALGPVRVAGRKAPLLVEEELNERAVPTSARSRKPAFEPDARSSISLPDTTKPELQAGSSRRYGAAVAPRPTLAPERNSDVVVEAASGDITHRVTHQGESLHSISRWYTGNAKNAYRIARINGIRNPDVLKFGQPIRIPRYLIRTKEPMPASAVTR